MSSADAPTTSTAADQLVEILRGRTSKAEAVTSGELADKLRIRDGEANPQTRELVRDVMESHDLPIVSCNSGYYVADSLETIESELESLDGRIAGIEERKQRLVAAYNGRRYDK